MLQKLIIGAHGEDATRSPAAQARYRYFCAGIVCLLLGVKAVAIDQSGIEWIRLTPVNSPGERIGQATAYDWWRGEAVVFGGGNPLAKVVGTDETWVFVNNA